MHHLTGGIISLLHSVNLILFTLLLVHLILHISPHHRRHLTFAVTIYHQRDLSLQTKNSSVLQILSCILVLHCIWTACTDLELGLDFVDTGVCLF